MGLLRAVVHVSADPVAGREVAALVELLAHEVGARRPGSRASARRLIDMLVISSIRSWLAAEAERPGRPWRAASAALVGEPPLGYLARWRMRVAAQRLNYSTATVETIAREVGCTSEFAFNRAFCRHRGHAGPPPPAGHRGPHSDDHGSRKSAYNV